ncbi:MULTISPECIES: NAD(P)H-dependent glycerol-3-phosphate dehydrogenase [Exiguobacterium]|uniref:Glycerol-3-phosphate dehydrogenase [NAD(P)+] n=1 Tax=Exiguobacterium acetylicum TaxID=41170 RepID=A0ABX8G701_EXIAC|nr:MULTISPECIES: NAD(P)H-dependent glycerol-3-phosphate dehydrogenase [Exiguobacterium]AOT01006.1 glycerol-3-phosphate dehydrogenase [Exiguobacterium sp. U13-1]QWB28962.1 NAD(P)H-dependent glycerol-3-phosphate dehydrogenase [Exiguobacterium acetylicum]HBQ77276.1 NAD(P)H-dependent glycerol-3-phosphate dehydrogenase [Exiguobacterium sp.]HCD59582.1 NAD(P)H-dependent glycerol-3-phosphate dehydrogenase [Exiguobacterium sp.]
MTKIAVIGAGSWGTALSLVLADNDQEVMLYGREQTNVDRINEHHENAQFLPGVMLPQSLKATTDLKVAVEGATHILIVTPSSAIRSVSRQLNDLLTEPVVLIHASKGIEPKTHLRLSELIEEEVDPAKRKAVCVLTGPSHAEEVALRKPTTVTIASDDLEEAGRVQELFTNENFRVYLNADIIGAELGGALKNIIALAAGMTDGLGYGDNAKAALITRGMVEIARLGTMLGANPMTFTGLTGMGDLIVTCTSVHSRNWRAGNAIGRGEKLETVLENMGMVVEGVRATQAAYDLAETKQCELPITSALYHVLFDGHTPEEEVKKLMQRPQKNEIEHLFTTKD